MPSNTTHKPQTPSANPERPDADAPDLRDEPDDSANVKASEPPAPDPSGLYVVVATPREGAQLVELHTDETAASRVSLLTYGSKQHRKELADSQDGGELPDGGGTHEINRRDIKVYRLSTTEVTDF
jgi:hypothetical protein